MDYQEFRRQLGKAGLTNKEFAELVNINRHSFSTYAKVGEVPNHWAVMALLMGYITDHKLDFKEAFNGIKFEPNKVRGAAAKGRFGGSKQKVDFNPYGDKPTFLTQGHGADIASQRADDLDNLALDYITPNCLALDFASGAGGQAARMQARGASVTAIDIADMSAIIPTGIRFLQGDMRHPSSLLADTLFRVIVWQRAVHYLPFNEASVALRELSQHLTEDGKLFLSASGLDSELGDNYAGRNEPVIARYSPLGTLMATKHDIHGNVCLYNETDMALLINASDFTVEKIFRSTFGNIKCVLTKK